MKFEKPEVEIIAFDMQDVIATSTNPVCSINCKYCPDGYSE